MVLFQVAMKRVSEKEEIGPCVIPMLYTKRKQIKFTHDPLNPLKSCDTSSIVLFQGLA